MRRISIIDDEDQIRDVAELQDSHQRRFTDVGLAGIFAKPFDPLTLAQRIATTLGWD